MNDHLEHIADPDEVESEAARTEKDGGATSAASAAQQRPEETESQPEAAAGRDFEAELATAQHRFEELSVQYTRLRADFDNYRRRTRQEIDDLTGRANERLITRLLPVLDNLDRAIDSARQTGGGEGLLAGIELVQRGLLDILAGEGLAEAPGVGAPFDPHVHEAVERVGDGEPVMVVAQYQKGYLLGGRVLRPAMVRVGSEADSTAGQQAD